MGNNRRAIAKRSESDGTAGPVPQVLSNWWRNRPLPSLVVIGDEGSQRMWQIQCERRHIPFPFQIWGMENRIGLQCSNWIFVVLHVLRYYVDSLAMCTVYFNPLRHERDRGTNPADGSASVRQFHGWTSPNNREVFTILGLSKWYLKNLFLPHTKEHCISIIPDTGQLVNAV
jgi:hypothetical protein